MQLTNNTGLPLSIAVWLGTDDYDYNDDPTHISATTLNKPLRAVVLARQNKELTKIADVASLIPSRMGTAFHTAIEASWVNPNNLKRVLLQLGYPEKVIARIKINPSKEELTEDTIPVYMEIRSSKQIKGFNVSGKFDFVAEGNLEDFKSTSTYSYIYSSNIDSYRLQGSIYRWLNPEIVTGSYLTIRYLFTDWSAAKAKQEKEYPQSRILSQNIPLLSVTETEAYINKFLTNISNLMGASQDQLPLCTPDELWQKPAVFKYYKDPTKLGRSTKNFDNAYDANTRLLADGNVGIVKEISGEIVRCKYCDVIGICDQAQTYIKNNLINF